MFLILSLATQKTTKTLIEVVLTFGRVGNFIILIPIS